jgi:uncharacterized protein (DUF849 family)
MSWFLPVALAAMILIAEFTAASGQSAWYTAQLSVARWHLTATSTATVAMFAGGSDSNFSPYDIVDLYNLTTSTWSTARLSAARYFLAATSVGDVSIFAGGATSVGGKSPYVAVYGIALLKFLSFFTHGSIFAPLVLVISSATSLGSPVNVVDIYNSATRVWSTAVLSVARSSAAATTVGNVAVFAGGSVGYGIL